MTMESGMDVSEVSESQWNGQEGKLDIFFRNKWRIWCDAEMA